METYKNFDVALYFTVRDTMEFAKNEKFREKWDFLTKHIKISHVYIETYRGDIWASDEELTEVKKFFNERKVKLSGGITTSKQTQEFWQLLCYSSDEDRKKLESAVRLTAKHFDRIIFDDFYFTDCRCKKCAEAKGSRTFREYRMDLKNDVSKNIIMKTAKEVNPSCHVIIKFPNWYPYHSFTGYNPKNERNIFDSIYTGTETRDHKMTQQNIPRYMSYSIMRYFENAAPGRNGGGWYDAFDCYTHLDYTEQGIFTVLSGAKEITLFCYSHIYDHFVPGMGYVFDRLDEDMAKLGKPYGINAYIPFDSYGEEYITDYFGHMGLPVEPSPEYDDSRILILTESSAKDKDIVRKMEETLGKGGKVITTTGFWREASNMGAEPFRIKANVRKADNYAHEIDICGFKNYFPSSDNAIFSDIFSPINDGWNTVVGLDDSGVFPVLIKQKWGEGILYLLNIPHSPADLLKLPAEVLNKIRSEFMADFPVMIKGESNVLLFLYDNNKAFLYSSVMHNTFVDVVYKNKGTTERIFIRPGECRILDL